MPSRPTALVTGAAQGIGAAITAELTMTHDVIAVDLDEERLHARWYQEPRVRPVAMDLRDRPVLRKFVSGLTSSELVVDALINNAGIGIRRPFHELTDENWDRIMAVNLNGPFVLSAACWPLLRKPGGVIVNISSIHGRHPLAGMSAYSASKGGLESLTRAMAIDAAPHGVRVLSLAPGFVHTPAWDRWVDALDAAERAGIDQRVAQTVPLGRQARPEEIADAVRWCIGDAAGYLTGTTVTIDGGVTTPAYLL